MNSLIRLWNVLSGLVESLTKTKELIDAANTRMEQSLGLDAPTLKLEGPEKARRIKGE